MSMLSSETCNDQDIARRTNHLDFPHITIEFHCFSKNAYPDGAYMKERERLRQIRAMRATPSELFITADKNGVSPKPFVP